MEKVKIHFISYLTEIYNKPFRLNDLKWSIMKANPRSPGPDGIHNNLLKNLPQDKLKILKEILNKLWTAAYFPHQRSSNGDPIPTPNRDQTDPISSTLIALTGCLCKVLECTINTHFIQYSEKFGILGRSQRGFRTHSTTSRVSKYIFAHNLKYWPYTK